MQRIWKECPVATLVPLSFSLYLVQSTPNEMVPYAFKVHILSQLRKLTKQLQKYTDGCLPGDSRFCQVDNLFFGL